MTTSMPSGALGSVMAHTYVLGAIKRKGDSQTMVDSVFYLPLESVRNLVSVLKKKGEEK